MKQTLHLNTLLGSLPPSTHWHHYPELGITSTLLTILKLAAEEYNNRQIAEEVCRSEHTVRNHIDKLKSLIGVHWRPELVAWAWRRGVMGLDLHDEDAQR